MAQISAWIRAPAGHSSNLQALIRSASPHDGSSAHRILAVSFSGMHGYDRVNLEWIHELPEVDKSTSAKAARSYDTRLRGYANAGHGFVDHFNERQRSAVLEHLKTL